MQKRVVTGTWELSCRTSKWTLTSEPRGLRYSLHSMRDWFWILPLIDTAAIDDKFWEFSVCLWYVYFQTLVWLFSTANSPFPLKIFACLWENNAPQAFGRHLFQITALLGQSFLINWNSYFRRPKIPNLKSCHQEILKKMKIHAAVEKLSGSLLGPNPSIIPSKLRLHTAFETARISYWNLISRFESIHQSPSHLPICTSPTCIPLKGKGFPTVILA